jgi:hypothetical protein
MLGLLLLLSCGEFGTREDGFPSPLEDVNCLPQGTLRITKVDCVRKGCDWDPQRKIYCSKKPLSRKKGSRYPKKLYRNKQSSITEPVCCSFSAPIFGSMIRLPLDFLPSPEQCVSKQPVSAQLADGGMLSDLAKVFGRGGEKCYGTTIMARPIEYGFGSMIHSIVKPAWKAATEKRSLSFHRLDIWTNKSACAAQDLSCFFETVSRCHGTDPQTNQMEQFVNNATRTWAGRFVHKRWQVCRCV